MNIPPEMLINANLKGIAARLKPNVFHDGNSFCVLYGKDPQSGVFGRGDSLEEALIDWDNSLKKAVSNDIDIKRIIAHMDPPEEVQQFLIDYQQRAKKDDTGYDLNKSY